jgi:hypothetical protein
MVAERCERRFADAKARAQVIRAVLERGRLDADDADHAEVEESETPTSSEGA